MRTIQMHLSQKQKIFSEFSSAFFESAFNTERFEKKDDPHSLRISEYSDQERRA